MLRTIRGAVALAAFAAACMNAQAYLVGASEITANPAGNVNGAAAAAKTEYEKKVLITKTENFGSGLTSEQPAHNFFSSELKATIGCMSTSVFAPGYKTCSLQNSTTEGATDVGRFDTTAPLTPGGNYLRSNLNTSGEEETIYFTFDESFSAFGFYYTDLGDFAGGQDVIVTVYDDTGAAAASYALKKAGVSGSLGFFGFYDTDAGAAYNPPMPISPIPELVAELAAGRMVILVDEEDRENEGDLVLAAEHVTPEAINFMARFARGLICLTLTREHCERLQLPPMASRNGTKHGTAFTVSIEAATGVTTGISAADRARTVQAAVARDATASDLVQPGHIFPLQAQDGGVLMRAGHTEAGCDLARMAGLTPAAVICEIMKDDGTMARLPDLEVFAREHGLKIGTIADLIGYRSRNESLVQRVGQRPMHTAQGVFDCTVWRDRSGGVHLALSHGRWDTADEVLVRVHEPFTALDMLDTAPPGHSWPLPRALQALQAAPHGVAVLLNCNQDADTLLPPAGPGRRGQPRRARRWTCAPTASARRSCVNWVCAA
jgi:3,4-dihydroxy 2-butanone 4-phosphate synthase/GTP cyclohydrolase II